MAKPVKRPYESRLRAEQALVTRRAIVAAAARLFGAQGYVAVSVDAIADAAGVSRATVFNAIGGKAELLRAAFRSAFGEAAGSPDEAMPLVERPRSVQVRAIASAHDYLVGYAGVCTAIHHHMALIYEAIREAARADPERRDAVGRRQRRAPPRRTHDRRRCSQARAAPARAHRRPRRRRGVDAQRPGALSHARPRSGLARSEVLGVARTRARDGVARCVTRRSR